MNAVGLDGAGNFDQILVEHGHEGDVVLGGELGKYLVEGLDVFGAVVGRERDSGQQNPDVRGFERRQHLVQIAASLLREAGRASRRCRRTRR